MKLNQDIKLDFKDVLIVPQRTRLISRENVEVERLFQFYHCDRSWTGVPIMVSNMDAIGTFDMAYGLEKTGLATCLHKHYEINQLVDFFTLSNFDEQYTRRIITGFLLNVWLSIGMKPKDRNKLIKFANRMEREEYMSPMLTNNICIDVPHGGLREFVDFCAAIREDFPRSIIMAGNVCTPNLVEELIINGGVDIVKIGIGPGSVCTTRNITGVGYPQLSAIIECAHAAHGLKSDDKRLGLICADGGCREAGDVCKAFCAGADFVMLGGMFAGCEESYGRWIDKHKYETICSRPSECYQNINVRDVKFQFYGMSSQEANDKYNGGLKDYRAAEGKCIEVPYKGPARGVAQEILGGIRSCCTYIGADRIKDMSKCAEFVRKNG